MTLTLERGEREPCHDVMRRLGHYDPRGPRLAPALVRLLDHPNSELRLPAAAALGRLRARRDLAVPALIATLDDPIPKVAATAARSLVQVGGRDALPALRDALAPTRDESVRLAAARGLAAITDASDGLGGAILGTVAALLGSEEPAIRRETIHALTCLRWDERWDLTPALPAAVRALDDPDETVRLSALRLLATMPDLERQPAAHPAVGPLRRLLRAREPAVRDAAVAVVLRLGPAADAALPDLLTAIARGSNGRWALGFLRRVALARGPRAREAIRALAEIAPDDDEVVSLIDDLWREATDEATLAAIEEARARIARAREARRGFTCGGVRHDGDPDGPRHELLQALRESPDDSPLHALFRAIAGQDEDERARAIDRLATIGIEARRAIPLLKRIAIEDEGPTARAAIDTLARVAPDDDAVVGLIDDVAMEAKDAPTRRAARDALDRIARVRARLRR